MKISHEDLEKNMSLLVPLHQAIPSGTSLVTVIILFYVALHSSKQDPLTEGDIVRDLELPWSTTSRCIFRLVDDLELLDFCYYPGDRRKKGIIVNHKKLKEIFEIT